MKRIDIAIHNKEVWIMDGSADSYKRCLDDFGYKFPSAAFEFTWQMMRFVKYKDKNNPYDITPL